jgi:membrane protease subunit (stomatin/prohibitin family)
MGIFDKLKAEFIDIVEWVDDSRDTLVWRFPRYQNEIKNGARLTVREGQTAVFVNEGQVADVFQPGMYTLATQNLPILSTLKGWKHGFNSPFKAEVYFVNTRRFTDLKWGTKNPVMLRDADFGMVRLRAFGSYVLQVADAQKLIREIVGTKAHFTVDGISDQVRNLVVSRFADVIGESKIAALDLAAQYDELALLLQQRITSEVGEFGLECSQLLVENISLPEEVEKSMDKRASMGAVGERDYTRFQMANAAEVAAANPGGSASAGMGLGMGFGMAQQMAQNFAAPATAPATSAPAATSAAAPPPLPGMVAEWWFALNGQQSGPYNLSQLSQFRATGQLTPESLVWKQGLAGWMAASQVAELQSVFPPVPPPLPPAL